MAQVKSVGYGKASGTIGDKYVRIVRGRAIICARPTSGSATTRAMSELSKKQRGLFGLVSRFIKAHREDINLSFDKTKYGSAANRFYQVNKAGLSAALKSIIPEPSSVHAVSLSAIDAAIETYATANPTSIYRIYKSGLESVYLTGAWGDSENPDGGDGGDGGGDVTDPTA